MTQQPHWTTGHATVVAAWQNHLRRLSCAPWLLQTVLAQGAAVAERFAAFSQHLRALPRRTRRVVSKQWATSMTGVALLLALGQGPVEAATFLVTNTLDSGTGSLRQAILDANSLRGADIITFGVTGAIALTSGTLRITDHLDIQGPGASLLTISGNNTARVFFAGGSGGVVAGITTTIDGLTITGGGTAGQCGGGLHNQLATMTVSNCTVSGNSAAIGGGICNFFATMTLINSTVANNRAINTYSGAGGGGIANAGTATLTLIDSTVSGNTAGTDDGGVVHCQASSLTISNSTISDNTGAVGGGLHHATVDPTSLALTRSIVAGNTAPTSAEVHVNNVPVPITANAFNLFGHSGLSNATAFSTATFTPGPTNINATSDGTNTPLSAILDPLLPNAPARNRL